MSMSLDGFVAGPDQSREDWGRDPARNSSTAVNDGRYSSPPPASSQTG
jgi:hypothetical protein